MGDTSLGLDDSQAVQLTGKIMMIAVLVLFLVVVFVLCLHLYAKWYWWNVVEDPNSSTRQTGRRRRRFVFAPGQESELPTLRRGLEPSVLKSLPVVVFSPQDFKDGLECAVCLSDLAQGEKARLLPKCNHGFHVECIDMWFQSHSTCPLCRSAVVPETVARSDSSVSELSVEIPSPAETLASGFSSESPNFPTNVLFWGNQTRVSSGPGSGLEEGTSAQVPCPSSSSDTRRPEGMLVIDIPSENPMASLASPSPSGNNRFAAAEEDLKSPVPTRLRSLKRLLSRDRRISPCSPSSAVDAEAGRAQS
ncbi:RING-H2 finger protein ATL3 [Rosa rugosa]|uniref:RING-H2 finger protein ATL3 n=1 Tax=Rosa rugosa TaxID=74645 RepID=UPI002B40F711|nr:RING-H2 finger protein ATL3 [Rosa rugosa]